MQHVSVHFLTRKRLGLWTEPDSQGKDFYPSSRSVGSRISAWHLSRSCPTDIEGLFGLVIWIGRGF